MENGGKEFHALLTLHIVSWQPSSTSDFVGLILEKADLPYPNHGHVVLGDPSPVLFYPVSVFPPCSTLTFLFVSSPKSCSKELLTRIL